LIEANGDLEGRNKAMTEKFLCIMAGYDAATEKRLSQMQNRLYESGFTGTHTKDIPQHITLGTAPVEREEEVVHFLQSISAKYEAFDIAFNHIGIFGGAKVLFVAPDNDEKLLGLKRNFGDCFGWTPHTTMLIDEPDRIMQAVPVLLENFSSFCGKVTTLHLYEFFPTRHILSVPLQS